MAIDLVKLLKLLDVNLDLSSEPIVPAGMITWLGRMYDIHPDHIRFGFTEGMEIWITGTGLAKLDLAGFETWLMDAPRGNHLLISERQIALIQVRCLLEMTVMLYCGPLKTYLRS